MYSTGKVSLSKLTEAHYSYHSNSAWVPWTAHGTELCMGWEFTHCYHVDHKERLLFCCPQRHYTFDNVTTCQSYTSGHKWGRDIQRRLIQGLDIVQRWSTYLARVSLWVPSPSPLRCLTHRQAVGYLDDSFLHTYDLVLERSTGDLSCGTYLRYTF